MISLLLIWPPTRKNVGKFENLADPIRLYARRRKREAGLSGEGNSRLFLATNPFFFPVESFFFVTKSNFLFRQNLKAGSEGGSLTFPLFVFFLSSGGRQTDSNGKSVICTYYYTPPFPSQNQVISPPFRAKNFRLLIWETQAAASFRGESRWIRKFGICNWQKKEK